jgi:argininosuccinate synthase
VRDLREEFVRDLCSRRSPAARSYEGYYSLGTSLARLPIGSTRRQKRETADGCRARRDGQGNDQVRFELTFSALAPEL